MNPDAENILVSVAQWFSKILAVYPREATITSIINNRIIEQLHLLKARNHLFWPNFKYVNLYCQWNISNFPNIDLTKFELLKRSRFSILISKEAVKQPYCLAKYATFIL